MNCNSSRLHFVLQFRSANAVTTLNDQIAGIASALSDISVENEGIETLAHKIADGI